ncbi:hypothetical protein ACMFMG_000338 [Clarireedia jacksonii]
MVESLGKKHFDRARRRMQKFPEAKPRDGEEREQEPESHLPIHSTQILGKNTNMLQREFGRRQLSGSGVPEEFMHRCYPVSERPTNVDNDSLITPGLPDFNRIRSVILYEQEGSPRSRWIQMPSPIEDRFGSCDSVRRGLKTY